MSTASSLGTSTGGAGGSSSKHAAAAHPSAQAHGAGPTPSDRDPLSASSTGLLAATTPLTREALAEVAVPENIRFRPMTLRDAAEVYHLGERVFHSESFPQLYRTWDAFEVTEMLATADDLCIVAEELEAGAAGAGAEAEEKDKDKEKEKAPGTIVGFVFGSITEKRKREQSCGMLGWVGVAPSHQRRNIGTVMVHKLFQIFLEEGIQLVIADTPMENVPAIRFLQRMGFGQPVSHVYMSLNLSKRSGHSHSHHAHAQQHHHHHHGHHHHHHHNPRHHHGHHGTAAASSASSIASGPSAPAAAAAHAAPTAPPALPAEAKLVKLRPMTIDDLWPVVELGERIYDATLYPNLYRIWSEAEVVEFYGSDSEYCQVAEYEGKVVGFVMGTTIAKRRSSWRYGYLVWLGVAPEVQRFGVGKRLFHAFKDLMEEDGCRIMMIDTQESNIPARRFFERAGFGSTESHVYFSKALGPEDAIASEERVLRQASLPLSGGSRQAPGGAKGAKGAMSGGVKVSRLFRFKRAHSLLAKATAQAPASASASVAGEEEASMVVVVVAEEEGKGAKGKGKRGAAKSKAAAAAAAAAAAEAGDGSASKRPRRAAAAAGRKK